MKRPFAALLTRGARAIACGLLVALGALPADAQTCVSPPTGLIAWWPLDGSPDDISGNAINPSSTSGISYAAATAGQGVTFGGSSTQVPPAGWIDIPHQSSLTPQRLTVAAWVKPQGPGPNDDHWGSVIVAKAISGTHASVFLSWDFPTSKFHFGSRSLTEFIDSKDRFPPGTFYNVVGTYDGTTFELFVNKVSQGTFRAPPDPINYLPSMPWTIGTLPAFFRDQAYRRTWNGVIDEVAIFNRALSQSEINLLHEAGSAWMCKTKGMTWRPGGVNTTTGTITVGCGPSEKPHPCDASVGDQLCTAPLPLLCFRPFNPLLPKPKFVTGPPYYYEWSGGIVATTSAVAPAAAPINGSLAKANARCEEELGPTVGVPKWRVAEFHDGGRGASAAAGWNFQAYGNVGDPKTRFWVHINDTKGTCFPKP